MLLSIIIPTLNEGNNISRLLNEIQPAQIPKEVIVVDGGSHDNTALLARQSAQVIFAPKGRARQMNAGAEAAAGDLLLFLHCDTSLQPSTLEKLYWTVKKENLAGGCLRLHFDDPAVSLKIIAFFSHLRALWTGIYFGDQGLFVRRSVFEAIGGFPDIPLMEDWEISRRLQAYAKSPRVEDSAWEAWDESGDPTVKPTKIRPLSMPIVTSSRRFRQNGIIKTMLLMHKLKIMYALGVAPDKIKAYYEDAR